MIKISDLHFRYNVRPILKGLNLDIAAGELLVLMGPGKSTLLGGTLWPHRGYVASDGGRGFTTSARSAGACSTSPTTGGCP